MNECGGLDGLDGLNEPDEVLLLCNGDPVWSSLPAPDDVPVAPLPDPDWPGLRSLLDARLRLLAAGAVLPPLLVRVDGGDDLAWLHQRVGSLAAEAGYALVDDPLRWHAASDASAAMMASLYLWLDPARAPDASDWQALANGGVWLWWHAADPVWFIPPAQWLVMQPAVDALLRIRHRWAGLAEGLDVPPVLPPTLAQALLGVPARQWPVVLQLLADHWLVRRAFPAPMQLLCLPLLQDLRLTSLDDDVGELHTDTVQALLGSAAAGLMPAPRLTLRTGAEVMRLQTGEQELRLEVAVSPLRWHAPAAPNPALESCIYLTVGSHRGWSETELPMLWSLVNQANLGAGLGRAAVRCDGGQISLHQSFMLSCPPGADRGWLVLRLRECLQATLRFWATVHASVL
ncbi:hypothetical protein [Jeongeupia chitinilytica]|uniref:Type III secretion system chaperone n=1 Tax=Jeongeupia chitinilytica TaxID=1041641 RepID=A0ABQ3GU65_9NEIS|nr:hypothetical protein [Jeongeupia chitinilytica]GHD55000.1 hypothetical protein GCM10007350_00070 [Jeongeupia chitinilytica]